jgi:hypothetical protein
LRPPFGHHQNPPQMHRINMRNQTAIRGNRVRIAAKNMQSLHIRCIHFLIRTLLLHHKNRYPRLINRVQFRHGQIRKRFHLKIHKSLPIKRAYHNGHE